MIRLFVKRGSSQRWAHLLFVLMVLLDGCAHTQHQSRPFFLKELELETHGRKTWFDRLIETDPGNAVCVVAGDYQARPPRKIAVLPFADEGDGDYVVNKLPLAVRDEKERARWSWTHANRLRRAISGGLGAREFVIVPLLAIDEVLSDRGITDSDKLDAIPPADLGRWLDADTVVYGALLDYEAYYAFLVAAWRVSGRVRMVSTEDGHEIFSCTTGRYDVTVSPVIDPIDIVIQSLLSLLKFRDISLARAEYEVGREAVLRLPIAERNISDLSSTQRQQAQPDLDAIRSQAAPPQASDGSARAAAP
jgi:hypothetical protein